MKQLMRSMAVAFSMYCALPLPQTRWDEKSLRYAILFLPLVGAVPAALIWGLFWLCTRWAVAPALFAGLAVLLPVLYTGGLHLDGFCDSCDALASHGSSEEKLRILKDPRAGAFAVIWLCVLLLLQFGAWQQLYLAPAYLLPACMGWVFSRSMAALAVTTLPKARAEGLAAAFSAAVPARLPLLPMALAAGGVALASGLLCGWQGALVPLAAGLYYPLFRRMALKQFGGVTGDLAGFFICVAETLMLTAAALLGAAL